MAPAEDVTRILRAISGGDRDAIRDLLPLVYAELHARAQQIMRGERRDHTLQATALVHEAYLKLVDQRRVDWTDRLQFFAVAARVMRRVLSDHARRCLADKRGGGWKQMSLDDAAAGLVIRDGVDVAALDEALSRLEAFDEQRAQIVELRFFGGMTEAQTAEVLGISSRTVERQWRSARNWLYCQLSGSQV